MAVPAVIAAAAWRGAGYPTRADRPAWFKGPAIQRAHAMRIAQIAPLHEAVPPQLYGGTERVIAYLTDALVELGHDVTLFASGDSHTKATLQAAWPRALRLDPSTRDVL